MGKEKEKEKEKEKKMFVGGLAWNCAAELKLLITALIILCSIATLLQFLPSRFSLSITSTTTTTAPISQVVDLGSAAAVVVVVAPPTPSPIVVEGGGGGGGGGIIIQKRSFKPYGTAAYNFILMSSYRGGLNTFAIIGLSSKPIHVYSSPIYQCQWVPLLSPQQPLTGSAYKILPDWGYGRVYTVVVINCTFPVSVGHDGSGGQLILKATTNGGGGDRSLNVTDRIEALTEVPGSFNMSQYKYLLTSPPKYDFIYCGSPLYGKLSPQRLREWLAYHVRLFGEKSHFVIHDAGGVNDNEEIMEVLMPWIELGYVTLQDIREEERFDGYYHNQFLVVNDCLHRYRFMAKWMFFFDVDEFIFVPNNKTIKSLVDSLSDYTQFTIEQMPMSNKLCLSQDGAPTTTFRKWGFEKLVYKDVKRGIRRDRKYAVQPRNVFATGVHLSQNMAGKATSKTYGRIKYFHYHGTIAERREPCRLLVNITDITIDGIPYVLDTTMREVAGSVKRFELKMIGSRLQRTRQ